MKRHKVVTFGEILMRLSPPDHLRFDQATGFEVIFSGAEFNVAASLSNFGIDTEVVTAIPDNNIANCALDTIKKFGVGYQHVIRQGDRLGIYFLENGVGNRNSKVVYDRTNSSISQIEKGIFDWENIFKDATWFHWSGITPAISYNAAEVCEEAILVAREMGLTISTDLNYRSKLWKYGKEPKDIMPKLLQYSDIILGDIDTALFMMGEEKISPEYIDETVIEGNFKKITQLLPNLTMMAMTLRNTFNASHQKIGGLLYKNGILYKAPNHDVTHIVDRVGTGDAFMGGLLFGLLDFPDDPQKVISFATAACVLKHTIFGDVNRISKEEVLLSLENDGDIKVDR